MNGAAVEADNIPSQKKMKRSKCFQKLVGKKPQDSVLDTTSPEAWMSPT
ncbi:hypothetical protein LJC34_03330 [Oscillospiraceae bacterium OttesenSCG-928-G22]|nr:hypothetical protein [Oscillospiraceae bacterium OttesenSCG-928-G22]